MFETQLRWFDNKEYQRENHQEACRRLRIKSLDVPKLEVCPKKSIKSRPTSHEQGENLVRTLDQGLYGPEQTPEIWHGTLDKAVAGYWG